MSDIGTNCEGIMERINVRVELRLEQELEAGARENGVRPSDIVREALEKHVRQRVPKESWLDIARRIGRGDVYKDAPSDLSTNPEHREGSGKSSASHPTRHLPPGRPSRRKR